MPRDVQSFLHHLHHHLNHRILCRRLIPTMVIQILVNHQLYFAGQPIYWRICERCRPDIVLGTNAINVTIEIGPGSIHRTTQMNSVIQQVQYLVCQLFPSCPIRFQVHLASLYVTLHFMQKLYLEGLNIIYPSLSLRASKSYTVLVCSVTYNSWQLELTLWFRNIHVLKPNSDIPLSKQVCLPNTIILFASRSKSIRPRLSALLSLFDSPKHRCLEGYLCTTNYNHNISLASPIFPHFLDSQHYYWKSPISRVHTLTSRVPHPSNKHCIKQRQLVFHQHSVGVHRWDIQLCPFDTPL